MNEAKPTSGWNEAKPSFPPDDLSAPVSPGGGHLGSREVSRIEYEQRGRIYHLEAEAARLRGELDDWENAAKHVEAEHPDEVHCGCVPVLRKLLADARAELKLARAAAKILT